MSQKLNTEPIQAGDETSGFTSGHKDLDRYFAKHALNNAKLGIGKTFVLRSNDHKMPPILGFYTLSMASVTSPQIEKLMQQKLPRYPLPVVLLGRLAVHLQAQGRGFGEVLLLDALEKAQRGSQNIGSIGVIVDAKNEQAQSFYEKYGFSPINQEWPKRLFLSFQTFSQAE